MARASGQSGKGDIMPSNLRGRSAFAVIAALVLSISQVERVQAEDNGLYTSTLKSAQAGLQVKLLAMDVPAPVVTQTNVEPTYCPIVDTKCPPTATRCAGSA